MDKEDLKRIRQAIADANSVVFLGGAGVSTLSGIPDFRSSTAIYDSLAKRGLDYETILSHSFFLAHPDEFYDFYWSTMVNENAKPNLAHIALADFEKRTHKLTIVTQNIDGLHQKAGSTKVLEAHGTIHHYHCMKCHRHYGLDELEHHGIPHCQDCGGLIKPDVVLYEEPLDEDTLMRSVSAVERANVLIIGGTSMRAYPIAGLPRYFNIGKQIIINAEATPYDRYCDFVIHEDIGDTLSAILGE